MLLFFINYISFLNFCEILHFLKERDMPSTFEEMNTTQATFVDDVHHALQIMGNRERYSVLKHFKVDDAELVRTLRDIGY